MTVKISFRISNKTYNQLQKIAEKNKVNLSDMCRTAITQYITQKAYTKQPKTPPTDDYTSALEDINQLKKEIFSFKQDTTTHTKQLQHDIHTVQKGIETIKTTLETPPQQKTKPNTPLDRKRSKLNSRM